MLNIVSSSDFLTYIIQTGYLLALHLNYLVYPKNQFLSIYFQNSFSFILEYYESGRYYILHFPSIILQYTTATIVLTAVAAIPGPTTAAGFTDPYWLRYGCVKLRLKICFTFYIFLSFFITSRKIISKYTYILSLSYENSPFLLFPSHLHLRNIEIFSLHLL